MPASMQEVKRRIVSTKKTGQITGAMQMVSTAKLNQIQKHAASYDWSLVADEWAALLSR